MTRSVKDQMSYLRRQHTSGSREWGALCLKLARSAADIPARYPSALVAQEATPREHRIYDLDKVKRGHVMYFDDPNDSNEFGHIATCSGRDKHGNILTWSNDVRVYGGVDLVRATFYPQYWGDRFVFASDWLNGELLPVATAAKPPAKKPPLGRGGRARLDDIIQELEGMAERHREAKHPKLARALRQGRRKLIEIRKEFS